MKESLKIAGYPTLWTTDGDGNITRVVRETNKVVTLGKNYFARCAYDRTGSPITEIAVGSGTTDASLADTSLEAEFARDTFIGTEIKDNIISYSIQFTQDEAIGDINEVGLFLADGTMICRTRLSSTFVKTDIDILNINWDIQFG